MEKRDRYQMLDSSVLKYGFILILIFMSLGCFLERALSFDEQLAGGDDPQSGQEESSDSLSLTHVKTHTSLAHIHLTGLLTETPTVDTFGLNGEKITSLKELIGRFDEARLDDEIEGVIVTIDRFALGAGQVEEMSAALASLHLAEKNVHVHVDQLDMWSYALFSSATHLSVVPTADIWLTGFYGESIYLKGLLDKIGVEADILHMGDYKAAGETFTRTAPSPEAAENMNWLFDGLYGNVNSMISASRGLSRERVKQLIDEGPYNANEALERRLVDSVQYRDAFMKEVNSSYDKDVIVKNRYGVGGGHQLDTSNPFAFFSLFSSMMSGAAKSYKDSVAVIYVEGMILPGFGHPSLFGSDQNAYSGNIRKALETAQADGSVKAVVLRVDSPGGSALASEIILHACENIKEHKPLIVSMGNLAASGGYYVSCKADHIWADPSTLTASIGVVGGKLVTAGMWDKLGVNWVGYKRGENADLLSTSAMFNERQKAKMTKWMADVYGVFKNHVVDGRGPKLAKPIDGLAGGRVYTGRQAQELGLVDSLGGLTDAIAHAAERANLIDYEVRVIPEPVDFMTLLMEDLLGSSGRESPSDVTVSNERLSLPMGLAKEQGLFSLLERVEPHRARAFVQTLRCIELMRSENVLLVMPSAWIIK
jgi:protease-4